MPRDGLSIYHVPVGTDGVPDTSIESSKYNSFAHDIETDLNTPRPIVAGGTGAATADGALASMGGEKSSQLVSNYDSHVWLPGSFYSAAGATNAPIAGHAFTGWVISSDVPVNPPANLNVVVYAYDQSDTTVPGRTYIREKKAGMWGPWVGEANITIGTTPPTGMPDGALWWDSDSGILYVNYNDGNSVQWVEAVALPAVDTSLFVHKTGDVMSGTLTCSMPNPAFVLNKATAGGVNQILGYTNTSTRWNILLGSNAAESGGNAGSDFALYAYNDGGTYLNSPITITRSNGLMTLAGDPVAALGAATKQYADTKLAKSGGTMTGAIVLPGNPAAALEAAPKQYVDNAITAKVSKSGDTMNGLLTINAGITANNNIFLGNAWITSGPRFVTDAYYANLSYADVASGSPVYTYAMHTPGVSVTFSMRVAGSAFDFWSDGSAWKSGGNPAWDIMSDERIKTVTGDYTSGLDAIAALRPVKYTFKGNETLRPPSPVGDALVKGSDSKSAVAAPYANSPNYAPAQNHTEFIGLIAQEAELEMPEIVSTTDGYIDGVPVVDLRSLRTGPLIFALINAVKELKARVEALEGQ